MKPALLTNLLIVIGSFLIASCSQADYSPEPPAYNGFMIDTTVHTVDSMRVDTVGEGSRMTLYSHTGRGVVLRIATTQERWPTIDGSYTYYVSRKDPLDTNMVSVCTFVDGSKDPDFWMAGSAYLSDGLTFKVKSGQVSAIEMAYRNNEDRKNLHYLGIKFIR